MSEIELQTAEESAELSESAPDTEVQEGEESPEPIESESGVKPGDPNRFAERMNKKHFEAQEALRQAEALQAENERLRAQLPETKRPVVPEQPDPYDADYADKFKDYTEAVAAAATFDAGENARREAEQRRQFEAQQKQAEAWISRAQGYTERAKNLGLNQEQLQVAGQTVAAYGVNEDLIQYILEDDQGPLITQFLARHPEELETIVRMTPAQAAVQVATVIKPKASASSGVSGAPKPADSLGGGGAPPAQRGPKGAKFT